ncbi:MAG: hypothetical protein ACI85F_001385 [Bacteroidia bacterium]|jgi:hypothetical protein
MKINFTSILLAIIACTTILSSCSRVFQVYELKSDDVSMNDSLYMYEDDTVKIIYDFWAERGIMRFAVKNKLEKPIYINWDKSKFIKNGKLSPYWTDETRIETKYSGSSSHFFNSVLSAYGNFGFGTSLSSGKSVSVVTRETKQSIIPPDSWVERMDHFMLPNPEEMRVELKRLGKERMPVRKKLKLRQQIIENDIKSYSGDGIDFKDKPAPVWRNYLSLSETSDPGNDQFIDNNFRLDAIVNYNLSANEILEKETEIEAKPSKFFLDRSKLNINHYRNRLDIFSCYDWNSINPAGATGLGISFSRLLLPNLELGVNYKIEFSPNRVRPTWTLRQPMYGSVLNQDLSRVHTLGLQINLIVNPKRKSRFGIGVNFAAKILPALENRLLRLFFCPSLDVNYDIKAINAFSLVPFVQFGSMVWLNKPYVNNTNVSWGDNFNFSAGMRLRFHWDKQRKNNI